MDDLRDRLLSTWRRTISLSWPIAAQETLSTLMRTTDIIVTGFFSPAAVAAIGLADLYAQIPMRIGSGLGSGAIALSSQETGRGGDTIRNRAITQAILLGFLAGVPFVVIGFLFGRLSISVLGASSDVARMGGAYLAIVFAAAPMKIVGLVGSRALQGTGDTRTPMYVNVTSNAINIVLTVGLGLGIWFLPELAIVGVGLATAISRTFEAVAILVAIASRHTALAFASPSNVTITRQIVAVSVPNIAEGLTSSITNFPFNALLLTFGTEVNAAYHIGRRIYHQTTGPMYRSYGVASSIVVGQSVGEGDPDEARFAAIAIAVFGVVTLGLAGAGLVVAAEPLAGIFTDDLRTIGYAADFTRMFGALMVFSALFFAFAGGLRGAGDTRTPLYARLTGTVVFMLGFSYLTSTVLDYGLVGIYAGVVLTYVWWALVVTVGFLRGDWADKAATMMAERADATD